MVLLQQREMFKAETDKVLQCSKLWIQREMFKADDVWD